MRLAKKDSDQLEFHLSKQETFLLQEILALYPLLPRSHHRLTRNAQPDADDQALLEESIELKKDENRRLLQQLLEDKARFVVGKGNTRLIVARQDIEWLLQVLNDVRVGSWLILGCPDPDEGRKPKLTRKNALYLVAMEVSGFFEATLIDVMDGAM